MTERDEKPTISRRTFQTGLLSGGLALALERLVGCASPSGSPRAPREGIAPVETTTAASLQPAPRPANGALMPVGFVGHGSPMNALDKDGVPASWRAWSAALPRPKAIVIVSAHWEASPPCVGAHETLPLIYDFGGFPDELYQVRYTAPGAPELAERTLALLDAAKLSPAREPERGLDHGAWVPLVQMFPEASVPVLQVSLGERARPAEHIALGRALAPLRGEGVFLLASGNLTHNLRLANFADANAAPDAWAREFDAWCVEVLEKGDLDALADYRAKAPGARLAAPTDEHFTPLIVAAAAASEASARPKVRYPYQGIEHQNLSMRSVEMS